MKVSMMDINPMMSNNLREVQHYLSGSSELLENILDGLSPEKNEIIVTDDELDMTKLLKEINETDEFTI